MWRHFLLFTILVCLFVSTAPASAEIVEVDPGHEPALQLTPAEAERLVQLQSAVTPILLSDISPDDTTILIGVASAAEDEPQIAFLNVQNGSKIPVSNLFYELIPVTNFAWRAPSVIAYVALDQSFEPVVALVDSITGAVTTTPIRLPGFPISMAPDGAGLLVVIENDVARQAFNVSPFDQVIPLVPERPNPMPFDAKRQALQVSSNSLTIAYFNLNTQQFLSLMTIDEGGGLLSPPAWTPDGSKLALVRLDVSAIRIGRGEVRLSEIVTQDGLGNLPPKDNPFFQGNVVDVFDLANGVLSPAALTAAGGGGDTFSRVVWSPDGQILMAQLQHPAKPSGRIYPAYLYPERSYVRFYDAFLNPIGVIDTPQISAPTRSLPLFLSHDEVVFYATVGTSDRLYYHNLTNGDFRQVSVWEGTYPQIRTTNQSRQIVFVHSSFQKPPATYIMNWDGSGMMGLTFDNIEREAVNQIRSDSVVFTLENGEIRTGYILQPAGASFPPQDVPIVVWQEGGPGGAMTNQWGTNVENPFNLLPNFGIALLVVPLPGREGFGPIFYNALADGRQFGSVDVNEGAEIVRQMIDRGYTSRGKVGVMGCSYGGYFASQSITRYPNLYSAANTQCSLLDLFSEWQFGFTWVISYLMGRAPTSDPVEYVRDSPTYNAMRVQTPLLIFHGADDFLPASIVINFHDQVAANGTPVKMLLFDGEGHGLAQPSNQFIAAQELIAWFRQYLVAAP